MSYIRECIRSVQEHLGYNPITYPAEVELGNIIGLLDFAVNNADKFIEHDPDGVKKWWIDTAKMVLKDME